MTGWMLALALADDGAARGELVVHVVYAEDSSVVRDLHVAAVRKVIRQWRRAQRSSDAPVVLQAPELPARQPVTDATVSVTGPSTEERRVDAAGIARFELPSGGYAVAAESDVGLSTRVATAVGPGASVEVWLRVAPWDDLPIGRPRKGALRPAR